MEWSSFRGDITCDIIYSSGSVAGLQMDIISWESESAAMIPSYSMTETWPFQSYTEKNIKNGSKYDWEHVCYIICYYNIWELKLDLSSSKAKL